MEEQQLPISNQISMENISLAIQITAITAFTIHVYDYWFHSLISPKLSMAGKKKNKEQNVVVAAYNVSMHCNACERSVAKAISKIKGVEKFMTDMTNHRVVVTGRIDPQKVLKKVKKKTGKKVELVEKEEAAKDGEEEGRDDSAEQGGVVDSWLVHYYGDSEIHMMFNDENANACSIM